ncbi:uncharacterized protein E0L32_012149 [Thyridium curvatum]|uniref:Uncharacterized protein n=1 Tax=Thyridium curvatum TaxID=1093900 RepID=A0A507BE11_9PEZI|nr:uncharacterized protein E0L32_012149 [Thyridium curvatum]TPX17556.1 hypothetical protein E0L32_012149 [Thyridium curvatum]
MATQATGRVDIRKALEGVSSHFLSLVEIGILRTFVDFKVFDLIPEEGDISLSELANKVHGDERLLERFSSYLVAAEMLTSPAPGRVAHTESSRHFQTGGPAAGFLVHVFNFFLRPMAYWPSFFDKNGLAEPKDLRMIPLGLATGHPDSSLYEVLDAEPTLARLFNLAQARSADIYCLKGVYDFSWIQSIGPQPGERLAIVDVGGGSGLALRDILIGNAYIPPQQCAVFDLPKTIEGAKRDLDDGLREVQMVGGTMLEPFPEVVRGAVVYQFRRVLSDFPDDSIVQALRQVRDACLPDSRILVIEEFIQPSRSKFTIAQDVSVMNFGGKRRSEQMFRELAGLANLRCNGLHEAPGGVFGVLEMVPV